VPEILVNWYKPPWETEVSAISKVPDPLALKPLVVQLNVRALAFAQQERMSPPKIKQKKGFFIN
jgi:hypothetical protein